MSLPEDLEAIRRAFAALGAKRVQPRPESEGPDPWKCSAPLLIEIGDRIDDLELLEERDAWPGSPRE